MTDPRGNNSTEGGAEPAQSLADIETERDRTGEGAGSVEADGGDIGERPLGPEQTAERADAIDGNTAGDGVQMFEGDLGLMRDAERSA